MTWRQSHPLNLAHSSRARLALYLSLPLIVLFLITTRPSIPFYALPLAPIALAALLHEFAGGTLAALAAIAGIGVLIALDPDAPRRAATLQEAWPILSMYLAVGPFVGWLAGHERERERELVAAARQLQVVQEIAQAINRSLDLDETLRTIFAETRRLVPFAVAAVLLREREVLRVKAVSEDAAAWQTLVGATFALEQTAAGRVVRQRQMWRGGPEELDRYPDTRRLCAPGQACLLVPLQFQTTVIGVCAFAGPELGLLSAAELDNLAQIAAQMAMAIEHARLFELQLARSQALAAISDAGRAIAALQDLPRTLRLVMRQAAQTLPMDAGALFLFDEKRQRYQVAVSHNLSPHLVDQITFAFNEGVPGWVVGHAQPLIIPDAQRDARVHPLVLEEQVQAVLALPLVAREQIVGVLTLYSRTRKDAFDEEAMRLVQVYADQAAVFIENAKLHDELRQAAATLEARVEERSRQLQQSQDRVIRAEKMAAVGRLAASVAHEVNNPLQSIALHLALMGDEPLTPQAREELAVVVQEVGRIAGIVDQLLDFQRPKSGKVVLQDVGILLDEVLALSSQQLLQAGVRVELQRPSHLGPVLVAGDQIKQVFLNLILNAVEAMSDGGTLAIQLSEKDGQIVVRFHDSGPGIVPEARQHLFEPFFSTKPVGTGLGLAVSQEIVMKHGGSLTASNEVQEGATFVVSLPAFAPEVVTP